MEEIIKKRILVIALIFTLIMTQVSVNTLAESTTEDEQAMYEGKSLLRSDVAKLSYELMSQPVKDSLLLLVKNYYNLEI